MKRLLIATTALIGVVVAQQAWADTQTSGMTVSGSVATVCTISTTALAFGAVTVGGVTNGSGTVKVTCTNGGAYDVGLDLGLNAVSTQRKIKGTVSASNTLQYGLFQDSGYSTPWGNTVGTDTVHGTGSGSEQDLTVYGQIPSQTLTVDTYGDTVTATVTY